MKKARAFDLNGTPIYLKPDENSKMVGFLDLYDEVYVHHWGDDWCYIQRNFTYGYVRTKDIIEVV